MGLPVKKAPTYSIITNWKHSRSTQHYYGWIQTYMNDAEHSYDIVSNHAQIKKIFFQYSVV